MIKKIEKRWATPRGLNSEELREALEVAWEKRDRVGVKKILENPQKTRIILSDRREGSKNLLLLQKVLDWVLGGEADNFQNWLEIGSKEVVKKVHQKELPETVLNDDMRISYHLSLKERFERVLNVIQEAKDDLQNPSVYWEAQHDWASWEDSRNQNPVRAIELNTGVIEEIDKEEFPNLYWKCRFGLTYQKKLKPRQKLEDYLLILREFERLGNLPDAFRAAVEAAQAALELSKRQGVSGEAFESLIQAKDLALESLRIARELEYSNLEIIARNALAEIYQQRVEKVATLGASGWGRLKKLNPELEVLEEVLKSPQKELKKQESFRNQSKGKKKEADYQTTLERRYK